MAIVTRIHCQGLTVMLDAKSISGPGTAEFAQADAGNRQNTSKTPNLDARSTELPFGPNAVLTITGACRPKEPNWWAGVWLNT
jgi:hypothetical protein